MLEISMSKLFGVLAFAGDKAAARSLACDEVSAAVVRAVAHNDRAHFVDTLRALPRGSIASAIAETFPLIEAHCLHLHADGKAAPVGAEASPMAVMLALHVQGIADVHAEALQGMRSAEPKERKGRESTLHAFGREIAAQWLASVDSITSDMAEARKAKAEARKAEAEAAKAEAEAAKASQPTPQGSAIGADGQPIGVNVSAMVEEVNAAKAEAEAATKRATLAEAARDAAKAEADTLRAMLAEAREQIAALTAAAEAAKAASEAAKAPRKGRKMAEAA